MAKVTIAVLLGSGADDQATSGTFAVRRVQEGVDGNMLVLSDWKSYTLGVEPVDIEVTVGELYESREIQPRGRSRFWYAPATTTNYANLEDVFPLPPGEDYGPQGVGVVDAIETTPGFVSFSLTDGSTTSAIELPQGEPGPNSVPTADFLGTEIARTGSPLEVGVTANVQEGIDAAVEPGGEVDGRVSAGVAAGALTRSRTDRLNAAGDSFVAGGSSATDSWAIKLGAVLGMTVYRNGNSGEMSGGVAVKAGAINVTLHLGTTTITAGAGTLTGTRTTDVTPCNMRLGLFSVTGVLIGTNGQVPGTFSLPAGGGAQFTWSGLASDVTIPAEGAKFVVDGAGQHRDETLILWDGRNDVAFAWPNHATGAVAATRAMLAYLTPSAKRAIVASVTTGTAEGATANPDSRKYVLAINAARKAAFPEYYYDVRRALIDRGLGMAGLTASADDLADIADDTIPRQLLQVDGLHLSNAARMVVDELYREEFARRGGVGTEPVSLLTTAQGTAVSNLIGATPKRYAPERYYTPVFGTKAAASLPSGELRLSPFLIDRPMILKGTSVQLVMRVSTAAAGSSIRVGLYGTNAAGMPGDLLLDAGTLDSTSTGTKNCNTPALTLPAGLYWIGALALGGSPSVMQGTGSPVPISSTNTAALIDGSAPGGYAVSGQAALPTVAPTVGAAGPSPVFAVILQDAA